MKAEGRDPEDLIAAFRKEGDVKLAAERADVAHGIGETWEAVRDAYLAWVLQHRNRDTHRGYRSALGAVAGGDLEKDFAPVRGKPIVSVTTKDLVKVRSSIVKRGDGENLRQADLTVSALKSCFKWYLNQPDSLIEASPAESLGKVLERKSEDLEHDENDGQVLTQDEMGRAIMGLESERNAEARLASFLQLLTGQRRMTACSARKSQFIAHPDYGMVWRLSQDKAKAWRVLPLPETARLTVETALGLAVPDNAFLFPQQRPRKDGDPMDGHISERRVSQVLEDMRAEGGALHGLAFNPATHTLRRTFVTVMSPRMSKYTVEGRRLGREDVKMITHANEGREGTASLVYDKGEYLDVKNAILTEWQDWCLEGYHRVAAGR
nr:tyrosine-type recombinase/integrase [Tianweitania sediminis]